MMPDDVKPRVAIGPTVARRLRKRPADACWTPPRRCSATAATTARASSPSPTPRASPRRPCTRASATNGRCSANSCCGPSAAMRPHRCQNSPAHERSPPSATSTVNSECSPPTSCCDWSVRRRSSRSSPAQRDPSPDLAELLTTLHQHRAANLRTLVDAVAANGPLRLSADDAVDTVWALTSPELHQLLTHVSGWTRSRYRNWLADSLTALLLDSAASEAPSTRSA